MKVRNKIAVPERILLVLMVLAVISNPLSGQYILSSAQQGLDWVFTQMFIYSYVPMCVFGAYALLYCGFRYARMERVNVPKKGAKTQKAGQFIE